MKYLPVVKSCVSMLVSFLPERGFISRQLQQVLSKLYYLRILLPG